MKASLSIGIAMIAAIMTFAAGAQALTVSTTLDGVSGSLRERISATPAGGSIDFNIPTSDPGYNSVTGVFTVGLTNGELLLDKDITIDGGGRKISIRRTSGSSFRIFRVTAGTTVALTGLGISNGRQSANAGIGSPIAAI